MATEWWKRNDAGFFCPPNQMDLDGNVLSVRPSGQTHMTDYMNAPREIELGDGDRIVATFDPKANTDLQDAAGQMGGVVYTFNLSVDGKPATMKGGKRLLKAFQGAVPSGAGPTKVVITARGEPRSLERQYVIAKAAGK